MLLARRCRALSSPLLSINSAAIFYEKCSPVAATRASHGKAGVSAKKRALKYKFVDKLRIVATGGKGGDGCISLQGENPIKKRPSGGSGGAGGRVFAIADKNLETLHASEHHFNGQPGGPGGGAGRKGRRGKDVHIRVPCGTLISEVVQEDRDYGFHAWALASDRYKEGVIREGDGGEEGEGEGGEGRAGEAEEWDLLVGRDSNDEVEEEGDYLEEDDEEHEGGGIQHVVDLEQHGQQIMLADGGKPGLGNMFLASRRVGTKVSGHRGESRHYLFELRTIADVGLVGYPNAGKSTLLGCITNAKPKVAVYPFTTLSPVVGHVEYSDTVRLRVADIPGVIEGAHRNRGLGHEFLRHVARTRALMFVVDAAGSEGRDPAEDLRSVRDELQLYDRELVDKPAFVVANKMDLPGAKEYMKDLRNAADPLPVIFISALESKGLIDVVVTMRELLEESERSNTETVGPVKNSEAAILPNNSSAEDTAIVAACMD